MSNTYFKIKTQDSFKKSDSMTCTLSLTAFVSKTKTLQLTVYNSTGSAYITLSKEDCINIIGALTERLAGNITATGVEHSIFEIENEKG